MTYILHSYSWNPVLVALYITCHATIAVAYLTMPLTLVYLANQRKDLPFRGVFFAAGGFILAGGTGHLLAVIDVWYPLYWVAGGVKVVTAVTSIGTTCGMIRALPRALALPSAAQLEEASNRLAQEIDDRLHAEAALRDVVYLKNYRPMCRSPAEPEQLAFVDRFRLIAGAPVLDAVATARRLDRAQGL